MKISRLRDSHDNATSENDMRDRFEAIRIERGYPVPDHG